MMHKPLDPVTYAILLGRLEQIADEMDATLYRSAFNPIIAEARDACHGLYQATTGATLVQGTKGLPIFVGAMAFAVKAVIDRADELGDVKEGDTFIFNDPYAGGTHLNDFRQRVTGSISAATCRVATTRAPPRFSRKAW
jgi:N-methylhydantoinase B